MNQLTRSYIALGSNLNDPRAQIHSAFDALNAAEGITLLKKSSLLSSKPMGPQDQPDYMNAVAAIDTTLSAHDLLTQLQAIENAQGRVREKHWGPRTLDLDLLLYGEKTISSPRLMVPHPGLTQRDFVLKPLFEIAPELILPDGRGVRELVKYND